MTSTSGNLSVIWIQLLYALPTILVVIAALVVCIMNWQKSPIAATFCLIGFGLIALNAIGGAAATAWMISAGPQTASRSELWSLITVLRIILHVGGLAFLLIAVFSGRSRAAKPDLFETTPSQPSSSQ